MDPVRLIEALKLCGLDQIGKRTGVYVRLGWPDTNQTLMIPLDPDAPEFRESMDAVRRELRLYVRQGRTARAVLVVLDNPDLVGRGD